jgi:hypothetical protein
MVSRSTMLKNMWIVGLLVFLLTSVTAYQFGRSAMKAELARRLSEAFSGFPESAEPASIKHDTAPAEVFNEAGKVYELPAMSFTIDGYEETDTLTPRFGSPALAKDGTKFVLVKLTVTNTGKEQYKFWPDRLFRLVDAQGRHFKQSNDHWQDADDYLGVRELGPGVPEKGTLIYETPGDSAALHLEEALERSY